MAGDFNKSNTSWGGVSVRNKRRDKADPILDIIESLSLINLLPIGIIMRQQRDEELIIIIMLAITKLIDIRLYYYIYST